ncbi:MAG: hypothetical protein AVDCRST_MAG88-4235 [uncultured Thermomicrobiales bacterium]|uniref:Uncharacterized protein n=1 Tax=uncultured Thermomicrobiales bacterium TaxID=1645740 RepID=A0A6J4VV43_9BACT|nr:MAG: hypothetical protein AVDCRST_MAG88-4235 [uncultured Thermomicrobiales bacterium]
MLGGASGCSPFTENWCGGWPSPANKLAPSGASVTVVEEGEVAGP